MDKFRKRQLLIRGQVLLHFLQLRKLSWAARKALAGLTGCMLCRPDLELGLWVIGTLILYSQQQLTFEVCLKSNETVCAVSIVLIQN